MIDERERYERAFQRFQMPEPAWDRLVRRRDRKRRNQRITAGALGIGILLAGILVATNAIRSASVPTAETPTPSTAKEPSVVPGTFEDVHGWIAFRSGEDLLAVDPADPGEIISLGSFHECPFGQAWLNRCGDGDPVGWSRDGTRLLMSIRIEGTGSSLYVLGDDGSRTRLSKETHCVNAGRNLDG